MAPRAGFEVDRKLLSVHVVTWADELSTPARTPLLSSLEFSRLGARVDAFAGWWRCDYWHGGIPFLKMSSRGFTAIEPFRFA